MKKLPPLDAMILRKPSTEQGTIGVLTVPEVNFTCFTIELPWYDNTEFISCTPVGIYKLFLRNSAHWKSNVYQFVHVPGRSAVQSHWGNVAGDKSKGWKSNSRGCVLLGSVVCQIWVLKPSPRPEIHPSIIEHYRAEAAQSDQPLSPDDIESLVEKKAKASSDAMSDEIADQLVREEFREAYAIAEDGMWALRKSQVTKLRPFNEAVSSR